MPERKSPVRWTQHDETLIACEVERIRENPEARENRCGNGAMARSMASQINIAQRVLPVGRRKSAGGVYQMKDLDRWYQSALARRATYGIGTVAEPEPAPPPLDPATVRRNEVAAIASRLLELFDTAIESAVIRAIDKLRSQDETQAIAAHDHRPAPPVVDQVVRPRIDIVGLKGNQRDAVEHAPIARAFDIRFLSADNHLRKGELRGEVILMSKFIRTGDQNRYRQMGASLHWANGGVSSVLRMLEEMRGHRGNGKATH